MTQENGFRYVEKFAQLPAGRYRYLEWGSADDAPTAVLLHGRTGCVETWDHVGDLLSDRFHVLALEQRGHGGSAWSAEGAYNLIDFLTDYQHFVDTVVGRRHFLVGHSMGACTSLVYAARHPDLVEALVLEDGGPPGETVKKAVRDEAAVIPESFASWQAGRDYVHGQSKHLTDSRLDRRADTVLRPGPQGRYFWRADILGLLGLGHQRDDELFDQGQWDAVADLVVPTMLLRSELPPAYVDEDVLVRIQQLNPSVQVQRMMATHEIHEEGPEEFVQLVVEHRARAIAGSGGPS